MRAAFTIAVAALVLATGCSRAREYELHGQVLAVDPARQEITIKHEDIKGFMPGMTMPFKVRDPKLLEGRTPGELVTATLVVEDAAAYLSSVRSTGRAPLTEVPPVTHVGDVLQSGDVAPDATLVDASGHTRHLSDWDGHTLAVTFIYTRCPLPDFCPRMDRNFAETQRALEADPALRQQARLLSVSFDPGYDTPQVLADHASRVGAHSPMWTFATGQRDEIEAFAGRFGVAVIHEDNPRQIVHNLRTAVLDGRRRVTHVFSGNDWSVADLVAAIRETSASR